MATGDGVSMVVKSHEKLCILPTVRGEKSGSRCRWKSLEWSSRKWKALHSWLEGHWNQSRTYLSRYLRSVRLVIMERTTNFRKRPCSGRSWVLPLRSQ